MIKAYAVYLLVLGLFIALNLYNEAQAHQTGKPHLHPHPQETTVAKDKHPDLPTRNPKRPQEDHQPQ